MFRNLHDGVGACKSHQLWMLFCSRLSCKTNQNSLCHNNSGAFLRLYSFALETKMVTDAHGVVSYTEKISNDLCILWAKIEN